MRTIPLALLVASLLVPLPAAEAQPPADLELSPLGIGVSSALAMRHANDGSERLFIAERNGTIVIYEEGLGITGTFLDIISDVDPTFEGGLLGLAFHPDFTMNDYFFVSYTRDGTFPDSLETVIERFTVSAGDPNVADLSSRRVIFTLGQPAANHNGGDIHFGDDGYLYIGLGDGGASSFTSQDNNNLLGKMLRIDPCTDAPCAVPYTVPPSNPFVGVAGADEIWSTGFRNPYRWSFDRATGDMFIADVGAQTVEEVSFEATDNPGGDDYGWNCREGNIAGPGSCTGTFVEPIITYTHGSGCSITGGYRYRGCIQGLQGTYIYADFCSARVWFADETSPGVWATSEWDNLSGSVFGFGEDENGELYLSHGNTISRFESESDCETGEIFSDGFESGDTSVWSSQTRKPQESASQARRKPKSLY